ncbi:MAG: 2-hydroxyacyl-CoA dehydratase family protein [Acidimicrobiales bacterium]|jgi:benzoyl-CoA reductase/2-hydroxyglutaryl-CoA dehydratase subunit BcrC/BadD/HgdB|nr:2-hydroxyacyl-CoA dehydratase family protein [Acidimicrobiales bacterium]
MHDTIPSRSGALAVAREQGRAIVAVLPYHYPRALLRAHRCHPIEVWGPPFEPGDLGALHFQAYTCGIVVKATSFLVREGFDRVDAVLVPHGCDALQGMGSVLGDFVAPTPPVLTFYPPRRARPADRAYLVEEIRALGRRLAEVSGHTPDEADWAEALAAEEAADAALADLYHRRGRLDVDDRRFYEVVRAREYLTAEDFTALAASLPEHDGAPDADGDVGLLLSGIVAEPLDLFDRLRAMGARVVADDLATGWRRVYPPSTLADPYERLADRLLAAPPDPTLGAPLDARAGLLVERLRASGARGLLIYDVTFCEPELFAVPVLRERVTAAGFGVLHVEHELGTTLPNQTLTRIEAFVETLR